MTHFCSYCGNNPDNACTACDDDCIYGGRMAGYDEDGIRLD